MHQTQHLDPARPCLKLALAHLTGVVHVFHGSPFQVSPAEASHTGVTQRSSGGLLCAECRERRVDRSTLPRKKISQNQKTKAPPKKNRLRHLYLPSAMSRSTNRDLVLMGFLLTTLLIKNLDFFGVQISCLVCSLSRTWVKLFFSAPTNKSQHILWGLAGRYDAQNLTKNKSKKKLNFKSKRDFIFW